MKLFQKNKDNVNEKKLTDKIFLQSIVTSVTCILLCVFALCSASYAWFSENTESEGNRIAAGSFDLEIGVVQTATVLSQADKQITPTQEQGVWSYTLNEAGTYTVTLTRTADSTANGYCFVTVGEGARLTTALIVDGEGEASGNPFVFTVTVSQATTLRLEPRWGIPASPSISKGAELNDGSLQTENG